ncbi:hypothetical protein [Rhodopila globiformis]|uniref:Uncharacterized protein n=1 Tax=Rhodopila globiformis TaxID=1071 RepID=A0A2S6N2R9_RHOGL|nr:hypothetical protein [Rhodopila globiformis]PPQ28899.1 hypothetical protein CCS01_23260 [Rhodopila globiformis]
MLVAAAMARTAGYTPIIVTQPDLRLREQGHADAVREARSAEFGDHGLDLGLDPMRGSPLLYQEVTCGTFVTRSLIFDIMQVRRARDFTEKLDRFQRDKPEEYVAHVAGKIVLIQDEADLFLDDLALLAEAAPTERERRKLLANIKQIESTLDRLVRDSHAVLKVSATICTNMLAAIKQGKAPPPEAIYVAPMEHPDYQGLADFVHRPIRPIAGKYDFSKDDDLPLFVDAVLCRSDKPVALINVHKHTAHHNAIKRELEEYIRRSHATLARECEVIEVNNTTGLGQNRRSVADLISDAHRAGKQFIFVIGGKKLDRGIRCASSNVFDDGARLGDGRHATDHFMRPSAKLVLPALQQQMRLSGRYPGGKPRHLWMPESDYTALKEYAQVQRDMLAELQKPVAHRSDLIPLSETLEKYLSGGMVLLMSERHKQFVGDPIGDATLFKTAAEARAFCERQGFRFIEQSDILWVEHLVAGLDPQAREAVIKGELASRLGRNPSLRVLAKYTKARNQGRRWRSDGHCIDLGRQTIAGKTGEAVLIAYMRAKDAEAAPADAEIRVELNEANAVTGFQVATRAKHLKLVA